MKFLSNLMLTGIRLDTCSSWLVFFSKPKDANPKKTATAQAIISGMSSGFNLLFVDAGITGGVGCELDIFSGRMVVSRVD